MPKSKKRSSEAAEIKQPAAQWMRLDQLHVWVKNPRKNKNAIAKVAASIERFGFGAPIVARKANLEIIKGHTRYFAAQSIGRTMVPVRLMSLPENEAHALAIADNKLGEIADWDDDLRQEDMIELRDEGVDLVDGMGFTEVEIEKIVAPDTDDEIEPRRARKLAALTHRIVIECKNERDQASLLKRFSKEGLTCRPLA